MASPPVVQCPACSGTTFKQWALPNFVMVHFVVNPGLAVCELLFGIRVTKSIYFCDQCTGSPLLRQYIWCPSCNATHNGLIWAGPNCFAHWAGLVCPDCGGVIPCLRNFTSVVILIATFPLWWFPCRIFRDEWLRFEQERAQRARQRLFDRIEHDHSNPTGLNHRKRLVVHALFVTLSVGILGYLHNWEPWVLVVTEVGSFVATLFAPSMWKRAFKDVD